MGRRKIEIQPITEDRNRTVTFIKRKAGLFKKAHELSVLCQAEVSLVILGSNNTFYEYSSVEMDDLFRFYHNDNTLRHVVKLPSDFGNFKKRDHVTLNKNARRRNYSNQSNIVTRKESITSSASSEDSNDLPPAKRSRTDFENSNNKLGSDIRNLTQISRYSDFPSDPQNIPIKQSIKIHHRINSPTSSPTYTSHNNIPSTLQAIRRSSSPPTNIRGILSSTGATSTPSLMDPLPTIRLNQNQNMTRAYPPKDISMGYGPAPIQHMAMAPMGSIPVSNQFPQVSSGYSHRNVQYSHQHRFLHHLPATPMQRYQGMEQGPQFMHASSPQEVAHEWYGQPPKASQIYVTASASPYPDEYVQVVYPQRAPSPVAPTMTPLAVIDNRYTSRGPQSLERVELPSMTNVSGIFTPSINNVVNTTTDSAIPNQVPIELKEEKSQDQEGITAK